MNIVRTLAATALCAVAAQAQDVKTEGLRKQTRFWWR